MGSGAATTSFPPFFPLALPPEEDGVDSDRLREEKTSLPCLRDAAPAAEDADERVRFGDEERLVDVEGAIVRRRQWGLGACMRV